MAKRRKVIDKRMIKIQADAYYQAMKKYHKEIELKESEKEDREESLIMKVALALNVFFFPWKINKTFKINNRIYDGILVLIIAGTFWICGTIMWGVGIINIIDIILKLLKKMILERNMVIWQLIISILMMEIGSFLVIAGNEFSEVKDSDKIYSYSASILAAISCIVAIISLVI